MNFAKLLFKGLNNYEKFQPFSKLGLQGLHLIHDSMQVYMPMCMCACVGLCACVHVCERERERERFILFHKAIEGQGLAYNEILVTKTNMIFSLCFIFF